MDQVTYQLGPHFFEGVAAEILSATLEGGLLQRYLKDHISPTELVAPLDTRRPPEERVGPALSVMEALAAATRIGGWIPLHRKLPEYEFTNRFYKGYRDHSVHSLLVYILGWYIYEYCEKIRTSLIHTLRLRTPDAADLTDVELFAEWWTLSSIWHDWGYLFETDAFLVDATLREKVFSVINDNLGRAPFAKKMSALSGKTLHGDELRDIYAHGGYYPIRVDNVDALLHPKDSFVIDGMFRRLGADPTATDAVQAVFNLTTQAPVGRTPYYDHGICGGLLLSRWWREAEQFTVRLSGTAGTEVSSLLSAATRENIALEIMKLEGIVSLAIEAISFHNLALHQWPPTELARLLRPGTALLRPGLQAETHLFFLCLCDTLQDWDRHHYTTPESGNYRPATPAAQLLVQAKSAGIYVGGAKDGMGRSVRRLFDNWLDSESITSLIHDGAGYTKKDVLKAAPADTLEDKETSQTSLFTTQKLLATNIPQLRRTLVEDPEGLLKAGVALDELLSNTQRRQQKMLPSEVKSLKQTPLYRELQSLQKVAAALVRPGMNVSLGYTIDEIGAGGFGTVYTVKQPGHDTADLAYKVYHAADLSLDTKRKMFRQGYDAMHRLRGHAGVVPVIEFSEFPFGFYMKYITGANLEESVGTLGNVFERLRILEQVADTLEYAHKRDVYHRDIKPSNVLIDLQSGHPVVTDFDLAWISGRSTISGAAYATMRYGAPEQFDDRQAALRTKPTVDVYSFGALMYFVLTEQEPIPAAVVSKETEPVLRERMQHHLLAHLADSVVSLIAKCVNKDPADRPPGMWAVAAELRKVRLLSIKGTEQLSAAVFEREFFDAAGLALEKAGGEFGLTPSGRVRISFQGRPRDDSTLNILITFELLGQASYNVISHDDYRTTVAKRIEKILHKSTASGEFTRHAAGMNAWSIRGERVRPSKENAWALAALARDVALTIE
jgi:serine/threonine protein kinase